MKVSLNLDTWYYQRELNFCPKHFVKAQTPLRPESRLWVLEKLHGRFYAVQTSMNNLFEMDDTVIYFEDPQEAVFYELTWS